MQKNKENHLIPEEISAQFSEFVDNSKRNTEPLYTVLSKLAESIIQEAYVENGLKPELPIDIELVAKKYNMVVSEWTLNTEAAPGRVLATLTIHDGIPALEIDRWADYKTRRYAMAQAIAAYLLEGLFKGLDFMFYTVPGMLIAPQNSIDVYINVLALFLLMPVNLLKTELENHINNRTEVYTETWLSDFSQKFQVPMYCIPVAIQHFKLVLCDQTQEEIREQIQEYLKMQEKTTREISEYIGKKLGFEEE